MKKENEELRKYIGALEKKQEDAKKNDSARRAMEETIKQLQKMVDLSNKNQEKAKREETKFREMYKSENELNGSLKV